MVLKKCLSLKAVLIILCLTFLANAQSGRRTNFPPPTPSPVPETTPTPQPIKETEPIKPSFSFQVVRNIQFTIYNQIVSPGNVAARIAERLGKSSAVSVRQGGESNRKESINLAKESEETHIILVTLSEEEYVSPQKDQNMGKLRIGRVWVQFDIFAPKTGKSIGSGSSYLDFDMRRNTWEKARLKRCYPNIINEEELVMLEVGYEIADRVLAKFNLAIPQTCK